MAGFAEFALARMPQLARRLDQADVARWLARQDSLDVDGAKRWLIWGDRLAGKAEMTLNWARQRGLVDEARLAALQDEYASGDPDTELIEASGQIEEQG